MKSLTVRLPETLVAEIERESQSRHVSKSDVVRERLSRQRNRSGKQRTMGQMIGNLIGSIGGLPADLSSNKKKYLPGLIRAAKPHRR
ncbi:MAG TPA: ribbon-helix-helix protein, CopG family [Candidatus Sulfotelmatobacter sp.]|nr:ribbon-helix-helix protein, CopG family [Candidatus Sulfotelmatobacter sp.]